MAKLSKQSRAFCHDLTDSLTIIGLAAEHMDHKKRDPEEVARWTVAIKEQCKKIDRQLHRLIDTGGLAHETIQNKNE